MSCVGSANVRDHNLGLIEIQIMHTLAPQDHREA